jgi:hypothetical protein
MRSDDLVPLLTPSPEKGFNFRQGVLLTYDPTDGSNTVSVGGATMTNLNIQGGSEAASLAAGDVVLILTGGPSWIITGKVMVPGSTEAKARLSSQTIQTATVSGTDSFTSTSYAAATTNPGPSVSIYVPASGKILVELTAHISGQSAQGTSTTAISGGAMGFTLSGANTLAAAQSRAVMISGNMLVTGSSTTHGSTGDATKVVPLTGLTPGLTTITAQYARVGNGTQTNFSDRILTVIAI